MHASIKGLWVSTEIQNPISERKRKNNQNLIKVKKKKLNKYEHFPSIS